VSKLRKNVTAYQTCFCSNEPGFQADGVHTRRPPLRAHAIARTVLAVLSETGMGDVRADLLSSTFQGIGACVNHIDI
jgi:hypothetical protein